LNVKRKKFGYVTQKIGTELSIVILIND